MGVVIACRWMSLCVVTVVVSPATIYLYSIYIYTYTYTLYIVYLYKLIYCILYDMYILKYVLLFTGQDAGFE